MLLSDVEIRQAMTQERVRIEPFHEPSLQPASYDLRVGKRMLVSGVMEEIDMERKRTVTLKAGQFGLLTSFERIGLSDDVAAHIGKGDSPVGGAADRSWVGRISCVGHLQRFPPKHNH